MEKIVKIKDIKLRNFNNAEYTQFLSNTEQAAPDGRCRASENRCWSAGGISGQYPKAYRHLVSEPCQHRNRRTCQVRQTKGRFGCLSPCGFQSGEKIAYHTPKGSRCGALHHYQKLHRCAVSAEPTRNAGAGRLGHRP